MWVANSPLSEDCLYLQVARPVSRRMDRIPVMVWIYGGSFYSGTISLDLYHPGVLATSQQVMVVSIQYRWAHIIRHTIFLHRICCCISACSCVDSKRDILQAVTNMTS